MNNPSPLIPQGSLLEQKAKGKPHLRVAIFIVAAHLVFLGFLLVGQGCKREDATSKSGLTSTNESSLPPLSQESLYPATNASAQPVFTNPPAFDLTGSNAAAQRSALPSQTPIDQMPIASVQEYVVIKGDSFYTIGKKFAVSASAIAKANPGVDSTRLKIGQKLTIPAPASGGGVRTSVAEASFGGAENTYVVKAGDTLSKIAKAGGASIDDIKALNGLKTDRINVGQKLKLPVAKAPAATNPASPTVPPPGGTSNL